MKFSIKNFFSKCEQIRRKHCLKKFKTASFMFISFWILLKIEDISQSRKFCWIMRVLSLKQILLEKTKEMKIVWYKNPKPHQNHMKPDFESSHSLHQSFPNSFLPYFLFIWNKCTDYAGIHFIYWLSIL